MGVQSGAVMKTMWSTKCYMFNAKYKSKYFLRNTSAITIWSYSFTTGILIGQKIYLSYLKHPSDWFYLNTIWWWWLQIVFLNTALGKWVVRYRHTVGVQLNTTMAWNQDHHLLDVGLQFKFSFPFINTSTSVRANSWMCNSFFTMSANRAFHYIVRYTVQ